MSTLSPVDKLKVCREIYGGTKVLDANTEASVNQDSTGRWFA
jgi:hypothetical protein